MLDLIIRALIAVCLFVFFRWLIPSLFSLLGVGIPEQVDTAIALLLAIVIPFWGITLPARFPWQK